MYRWVAQRLHAWWMGQNVQVLVYQQYHDGSGDWVVEAAVFPGIPSLARQRQTRRWPWGEWTNDPVGYEWLELV